MTFLPLNKFEQIFKEQEEVIRSRDIPLDVRYKIADIFYEFFMKILNTTFCIALISLINATFCLMTFKT